jgi:hypothetical protein
MNTNFFSNFRALLRNARPSNARPSNARPSNARPSNARQIIYIHTNYNDFYNSRTLPYRLMYNMSENNTSTPFETIVLNAINNAMNNALNNKVKKVITEDDLLKLKHIQFKKEDEISRNTECPIMCYEFSENEEIIQLPCQHNFNKNAILKWLKEESHTCPVCRYEFEYKEPEESTNNRDFINFEEFLIQELLLRNYNNNH